MNTRMRMALTVAVAVAGAAVAGPAAAGTQDRLGTGGNQLARIYVGARSVGIAFANVASVQGVEAMFANPAGLAAPNAGTEFSFSSSQYIADMNLNYMTLAQDMGTKGVIGLSIKVLNIGDIVRTTEVRMINHHGQRAIRSIRRTCKVPGCCALVLTAMFVSPCEELSAILDGKP